MTFEIDKYFLPVRSYWIPILEAIDEAGGSAHSNDVIADLEERMKERGLLSDESELRALGLHRRLDAFVTVNTALSRPLLALVALLFVSDVLSALLRLL